MSGSAAVLNQAVQRRVRDASAALFSAMAAADRAGLLDQQEMYQLRVLHKSGGRRRLPSDRAARATERNMKAKTQDLLERLHTAGLAIEIQPETGGAEKPNPESGDGQRENRSRGGTPTGESVRRFVLEGDLVGEKHRPVHRSRPAIDELTDEQRAELALRHDLMLRIEGGTPIADALNRLGIDRPREWVKRLRKNYRKDGLLGLMDGRWANGSPRLPDEVRAITLHCYRRLRGAGPKAIAAEVERICTERKLPVPSEPWVKWFIGNLPRWVARVREGGMEAWERQDAPRVPYDRTRYANQDWQIDHCRADIWVRVEGSDGNWIAAQVWVTAIMDVHSRAIMSVVVSTKTPDAWTTAIALRKAILAKPHPEWRMRGIPEVLVLDHGKDFKAHSVAATVKALGIQLSFCPPHYPNLKAQIERWFGTLQRGLYARLPGYKGDHMKSEGAAAKRVRDLLTLPRLREETERWIVNAYHAHPHEGLSRGKDDEHTPAQVWEETVRLYEREAKELDALLLKSDKVVTIQRGAVTLRINGQQKRIYVARELAMRAGQKVRLRYNPEDTESLLVYEHDTGKLIVEAWLLGACHTWRDVKRWRTEGRRYIQGVEKRLEAYMQEVDVEDRRSTRNWDDARKLARGDGKGRVNTRSGGGSVPSQISESKPARKSASSAKQSRTVMPQPNAEVLSLLGYMEKKARGAA